MATEDCMEFTSGSQSENVENDLYNDVNITTTLITVETKGGTALEAEKITEEVNVSAVAEMAAEIATAVVDGLEKADELSDNDVENDKKVEAIHSSSNKETKKILRKRKKNAEEASAHIVSSPPKMTKKKTNDASAKKMKEGSLGDKSTEGNGKKEVKSDGKLLSIEKGAIPEDNVEKADSKDVNIDKKVEGTVKKTGKAAKKKIVANVKGGNSNAEPAPTKPSNVAAVEDTSGIEENLTSDNKNAIPGIEKKDAEGTKDKPSPSASEKHLKKDDSAERRLKKVDGMGLIFMCNAKTKKDCFKYNLFGLPESKKAVVAKIYKGMRLFLFDFDLKLLYGIYKAASPGGYNIEPKAFKSKFPSQVRFTVLTDCLPLPEEKFKVAIKENYVRNKFDCQLSPEQVKKLCKLFQNATGSASKHRAGAIRELKEPSSRTREPRRRFARREAYPSPPPQVRRLSPPPRALPLQPIPRAFLAPQPSYAYERPGDDYYYRRAHHGDVPIIEYHDSFYREPVLYREPAYPPTLPPAYAARLREPRSPPRYLY